MLFKWRKLITAVNGPESAITRHVLLTLSLHMDTNGCSCYPSTRLLAVECALSERSICTHLSIAVRDGWIRRGLHGCRGHGWRRYSYEITIPANVLNVTQCVPVEGAEESSAPVKEGTERRDREVLKLVQSSTSVNSSINYREDVLKRVQHVKKNRKQPPKTKRRTGPPDAFPVTPEMQTWASSRGFNGDLNRETEKFFDYHRSKGSLFASWPAAWRTWVNRAVDFAGPTNKVLRPEEYNHDKIFS
jgi:hypothetical protein